MRRDGYIDAEQAAYYAPAEPPRDRRSVNVRCPQCDAEMRMRTNRTTGDDFLGCSRFPECRGSRKLGWRPAREPHPDPLAEDDGSWHDAFGDFHP